MGNFIEDLKRERAVREDMERKEEKKRQDKILPKKEKILRYDDQQYRASIIHANESNFPNLIRELRSVIPIKDEKFYFEDKQIRKWDEIYAFIEDNGVSQVTGAQFTLGWDYRMKDAHHTHKKINVKFYPDGKIRVEGGLLGTTDLFINEWRDNLEVQEKALEKAFKHPGRGNFVRAAGPEMGGYGL